MAKSSKSSTPPPRPAKSRLRNISSSKLLQRLAHDSSADEPSTSQAEGNDTSVPAHLLVLGDQMTDAKAYFEQLPPAALLDVPVQRRRTISVPSSARPVLQQRASVEVNAGAAPAPPMSYFPSSLTRKASSSRHSSDGSNHSASSIVLPTRAPSTVTKKSSNHLQTIANASVAPLPSSSKSRARRQSRVSLNRPPSSTIATTVARSAGAGRLSTYLALNRATVILDRLARWHTFLKAVTQWLDETAKQSMAMARGFSSHRQLFQTELVPNQIPAIDTVLAGLRMATMTAAETHHTFASTLLETHLPALMQLRHQCKEMARVLRTDPRLLLDELLRRAAQTKKAMDHLHKVCQDADRADKPSSDPWLANLYVLRQLKHEVEEENRLRGLMVPIQREMALFEAKVLQCLKPAIRDACLHLAPTIWDGSADDEAAPFQWLMERILPDTEWDLFVRQEGKELVDEEHAVKDYLNIYYPNKLHPKVVTLKTGRMQRLMPGLRSRFAERAYVLTQGGFLHQFRPDHMHEPERSIFVPGASVHTVDDCTLEIRVSRVKTYVIQAFSSHDAADWHAILSDMALGKLALILPRPPRRLPPTIQPQQAEPVPTSSSTTSLALTQQEKHLVESGVDDPVATPMRAPPPTPPSVSTSTAASAMESMPLEQQNALPTPSSSTTQQHQEQERDQEHETLQNQQNSRSLTAQSGQIVQQDEAAMASYSSSSLALPLAAGASVSASSAAANNAENEPNASTYTITRHSPRIAPNADAPPPDALPPQYPPTLEQLQLHQQQHGGGAGADVDDDDSSSTFSGHSVSTVTTRYSMLPTTSNQQYTTDPETSSIFTQYEDAASHISSHRLSTVSTQFEDAASSLYFSSHSTRASTLSFDSALSHDSLIDLPPEPLVIPSDHPQN
ncbi:hypothetical protein BC940DRAFT_334091 [Gongronella butleri]|nr:hypothetical protein BC940DRAFT_334091 [Gongronella butleri]